MLGIHFFKHYVTKITKAMLKCVWDQTIFLFTLKQ